MKNDAKFIPPDSKDLFFFMDPQKLQEDEKIKLLRLLKAAGINPKRYLENRQGNTWCCQPKDSDFQKVNLGFSYKKKF